jgi:hypothetical protein
MTGSITGIATPGTHKPEFEPADFWGNRHRDAFLAKLNSFNGTLQWGTYYGGNTATHPDPDPPYGSAGDYITSMDFGLDVAIDGGGNIVMVGQTSMESAYSNGIATPGSHQPQSGGSNHTDGFIAKFNSIGRLSWGTYYGGNDSDGIIEVEVDNYSNIYVAGVTASSNNIASSTAFQPTYGGGTVDGFFAIFAPNGVRQSGSYYGGSQSDAVTAIALANDLFVIAGESESTNGIATSGTPMGGDNAFLVKFSNPGVRPTNIIRYISLDYGGGWLPPQLCASSTVSIPYSAGGSFNTGNQFIVQLSDASGSFATPIVIGTSTAASGSISATIPAGTPAGDNYKIRIVSSSPALTSCTESRVLIGIGPNTISRGNGEFCYQAPALIITGSIPDWGGVFPGTYYVYSWEKASNASGPWTSITGATTTDYAAPRITETTYYRRKIMSSGGTCPVYSNVISRIVTPSITYNGFISTDILSCGPVDPPLLNATTVTGGTGSVNYVWLFSYDNINWFPVPSVTTEDFNPPIISETTYFKRMVSSGGCSSVSNPIVIRIDQPISNNTLGGESSTFFCTAIDPEIIIGSTSTGGSESYSYGWEKSNNASSWTPVGGAIAKDYNPPSTTTTIYYRRRVTSGTCAVSFSNIIGFELRTPPLVQAIITSVTPPIICSNQTISLGVLNLATSYQWKKDGVIIPGATLNEYIVQESSLAAGTYVYTVDMSNGCITTSNPSSVTIERLLSKNVISGDPSYYPGEGCGPINPPIIDGTTVGIGNISMAKQCR